MTRESGRILLTKAERLALQLHLAFAAICLVVMTLPLPLAPGLRFLLLVILYNISLPLLARRYNQPEWYAIWVFAFVLSLFSGISGLVFICCFKGSGVSRRRACENRNCIRLHGRPVDHPHFYYCLLCVADRCTFFRYGRILRRWCGCGSIICRFRADLVGSLLMVCAKRQNGWSCRVVHCYTGNTARRSRLLRVSRYC